MQFSEKQRLLMYCSLYGIKYFSLSPFMLFKFADLRVFHFQMTFLEQKSTFFFLLALLDDLDKELNNYIMRCREWYGWHFPELGKIITDNLTYCKCVRKVGE